MDSYIVISIYREPPLLLLAPSRLLPTRGFDRVFNRVLNRVLIDVLTDPRTGGFNWLLTGCVWIGGFRRQVREMTNGGVGFHFLEDILTESGRATR